MKFVALLALVALCVAAVPSMRNRPWRMGKVRHGSGHSHGHSTQKTTDAYPHSPENVEPKESSQPPVVSEQYVSQNT